MSSPWVQSVFRALFEPALDPDELMKQIPSALPAVADVLDEAALHDVIERRRRQRLHRREHGRLLLENGCDDTGGIGAVEGSPACKRLVQHGAKSENVGAEV